MNALSLIAHGFGSRSQDHGRCSDIVAGSGEDGCIPLAVLDLLVHMACPCALGVEVLWTRASAIVTFVGLVGLMNLGSF